MLCLLPALALLLFLFLQFPKPGGFRRLLIILLQQPPADDLLHKTQDIVGDPVDTEGCRHSKTDPQGHEGSHQHHHAVGAVILLALVEIICLGSHKGKENAGKGGHHRDEKQSKAHKSFQPKLQVGLKSQVHAEEGKVDGKNLLGGGPHSSLDSRNLVWGNERGQIQLVIPHIGKLGGLLDPSVGSSYAPPVQSLGHGRDLFPGKAHHVLQGLADDGIKGKQDKQGQKGPQTPAHGVGPLLLIKLLDLLLVALLVLGILLLQLLDLAVEHVHLDHALLSLQGQGEEDHLHHQGKEDQSDAVAVKKLV